VASVTFFIEYDGMMMTFQELNNLLGNIDLYLLDQILKGRFEPHVKIFDAGCGEGRNLMYFMQQGYDVYGLDSHSSAIQMLQFLGRSSGLNYEKERFVQGKIEELFFPDSVFDRVICNAVLHFAQNETHFYALMDQLLRVLKPEGIIFIRSASDIGLEKSLLQKQGEQYYLPDGSLRFLLTKTLIDEVLFRYNLSLIEPVKTVLVENIRAMTTLVLKKNK
jgi:tellurite methyltransferase